MTNLIALRNKHKEEFEKSHGVKLGFMSAFVRVRTVLTALTVQLESISFHSLRKFVDLFGRKRELISFQLSSVDAP